MLTKKLLWTQQVRRRHVTAWMDEVYDDPLAARKWATCRFADLAITATQVISLGQTDDGLAGGTITAGMSLYLKASDGRWYAADANVTVEEAGSQGIRIAANGASAGQPLKLHRSGTITLGAAAAMTIGEQYGVSTNAGKIAPMSDLTAGIFITFLGIAITAANLAVPSGGAVVSGIAHA